MRRMAVHGRPDIRAVLHDRQVQQDLAGPLTDSGNLVAVEIDGTDVLGTHEALADHRRRTQHLVLTNADRDVTIIGRGKALVVDPPADLTDLFFQFAIVDSAIPLLCHHAVSLHFDRIKDGRVVGIDRFLLGCKRCRRLGALGNRNP